MNGLDQSAADETVARPDQFAADETVTRPDHAAADDAATEDSSGDERSMRAVLFDRTFGAFFATNALSNVGNWFQNVAAGIVVFDLTGSNTAVGAVSMLQFAATMLLTPWMGAVTDRVDRRRMLLVGQFVALSGAAALAATVFVRGVNGLGGPWPIYAATTVIGLGAAITLPSLQAIVPALVRKDDLDRAIALNSMTFNIARAIGPVAAGAVVAGLGAAWAFGINALTFVPLIVFLVFVTPRGETAPDQEGADGSVRDGIDWIRERPGVVAVISATLVVGWTSDPFSTLMPAMADELGGGEVTVGLLVGCFGLGAAVTAPLTDRLRSRVGRPRMIPLGLAVVATGLGALAFAPLVGFALVAAAIAGSGFLIGVTSTNAELQAALPEELRGRVMAWWSVAFLGCRPLAALVDGIVADITSVRVALLVAAALALAAGATGFRRGGISAQPT